MRRTFCVLCLCTLALTAAGTIAAGSGEVRSIESGQLQIDTLPPGASVFINGRLVGATPLSFESVPAGVYRVRLEKEGCTPLSRSVDLTDHGVALRQKLAEVPRASLLVALEPKGAEVLLNGALVGHTPLKLDKVPVGTYELLVRKPNFESYSKQITLEADAPQVFEGFGLRDKLRAMLENLVKSEPQRAGHYLDLGHYLFVNGQKDEALNVFLKCRDIIRQPLDFDGAGYPGKANMSPEEQAFEHEQRQRDIKRFQGEMNHARYGGATQSLRGKQ